MRIVFWQHQISITDIPYISQVAEDKRVEHLTLVANDINDYRKKMGWDSKILNSENIKFKVCLNPTFDNIKDIIKSNTLNSIHLFSGLNAYPHVFYAFKESLNYSLRRCIIAERPMTYYAGVDWLKPLWLHRLYFNIKNKEYINSIDSVFGIGEESCDYYRSINNKWKIFPFIYCTQNNQCFNNNHAPQPFCKIVYVGSLSRRKSVITLLKAFLYLKKNNEDHILSLDVIGSGDFETRLKKYAQVHHLDNVKFLGMKMNDEIQKCLSSYDVLVLPSIHDGWGAVANEGLQAGLYTIVSDHCGSKEIINNNRLGTVFKMGKHKDLANSLDYCATHLSEIRKDSKYRRDWADNHISGKVIADYLVNCLISKNIVECPWKKE